MPQLQDLDVEFVSLVDRAAVRDPSNPSEAQRFLLWKAESGPHSNSPEGGVMTEAELTAALQKAEQERDEAQANLAKAEKKLAKKDKSDESKPENLDKSALPDNVREALEKAEARAEALEKQAAEDAKIAKEERDLRISKEFIAKAETEFPNVGGNSQEFGQVLKAMSETLSEDVFKAVETRLRAAEEQVKTGHLFKELGQGGDPNPGSDVELDAALQKADDLQKADPTLSRYDAMRLSMNREQQAAYLAANR